MKTYRIPENFIDGGKLFGGTIKTRNFIEALIFGGIGLLISSTLTSSLELTARITIIILCAAPPFVLAIAGINNEPLSVYIQNIYRWRKNKKIMLYNNNTKNRNTDIVKQVVSDRNATAELIEKASNLFVHADDETDRNLVEGVDFVFETDDEETRYTASANESRSILDKLRKR